MFQIPLPPVDERKKVVEDVDKDRRYATVASILRRMKSRKVLGHQQLVMECVEQLSRMFKVCLRLSFILAIFILYDSLMDELRVGIWIIVEVMLN